MDLEIVIEKIDNGWILRFENRTEYYKTIKDLTVDLLILEE